MKVLERKDWKNAFKWECTCPQCESKLLIESEDLHHSPGSSDMYESSPEGFTVYCEVCRQAIAVPPDEIPAYIKKLARDRRRSADL